MKLAEAIVYLLASSNQGMKTDTTLHCAAMQGHVVSDGHIVTNLNRCFLI